MREKEKATLSKSITRRALVVGAAGTLASMLATKVGYAATADIQRAYLDDVLDTYYVFYCPQDTSKNLSCYSPKYKTLSYKNGYSRIYPDEEIWYATVVDPKGSGLPGVMKQYRCNYKIW